MALQGPTTQTLWDTQPGSPHAAGVLSAVCLLSCSASQTVQGSLVALDSQS